MNKNFLYIFLLVIIISCNNQVENKFQPELPNKIAYDTILRNQKIKDANSEILKGNVADFYKISSSLEKQAINNSDTSGILYARMNLGYYFSEIYQIDSAYFYLTSAEKLSKNTKSKELLEYLLQYKADILWSQKNYLEAQAYSIEALKILKIKKNPELEHTCYVTIANSLEGVNKNNEALKYYNKALEVVNSKNVAFANSHASMLYFYISTIYEKQNNITKSIEFIKKGLSNNNLKIENIRVYSYLKNILGKSIYKTQKEKALSIYTENLKIGDSLNFAPLQVTSQIRLGEYFLYYKDTIKANIYLQNATKLAHQNKIFDDELIILQILSKSNPSESNYYSERYIRLNDSLLAVERATRDKFARIEFETDEISNQKNHFEKENKKLTAQLLIAVGFALLLLLSIYLWFKNKSNKAKITELKLLQEKQELQNNELLFIQEQQRKDEKMYQLLLHQQDKIEQGKQAEKIRISREIHDGIMGKLSGIRLNLYILKKKTDPETIARCLEYIKEMQVIENDLRKLSHDLNKETISTAEGIENEIKNLFSQIKNHQNIKFDLQIEQGLIWENINYIAKLNLYRIIQEALHNIDKYAKAKKVVITIAQKEHSLLIQIKDDGIGFDSSQKKEGIGLKNMRERTEESGGTFSIETAPKKGTIINLLLPF